MEGKRISFLEETRAINWNYMVLGVVSWHWNPQKFWRKHSSTVTVSHCLWEVRRSGQNHCILVQNRSFEVYLDDIRFKIWGFREKCGLLVWKWQIGIRRNLKLLPAWAWGLWELYQGDAKHSGWPSFSWCETKK